MEYHAARTELRLALQILEMEIEREKSSQVRSRNWLGGQFVSSPCFDPGLYRPGVHSISDGRIQSTERHERFVVDHWHFITVEMYFSRYAN